jgi:sirohydrochlorin ferrochelatase
MLATKISVVPILLLTAVHTKKDITEVLEEAYDGGGSSDFDAVNDTQRIAELLQQ